MHPKYADGMANGVDPDQTAPLILVYTLCLDLNVQKLRIITVAFIITLITVKILESSPNGNDRSPESNVAR